MTIDLKLTEPIELVKIPGVAELEAAIKDIFFEEAAKLGLDYELYPSDPVNFCLKAITLVSFFQLRQMREGDLQAFLPFARGEALNNIGSLFGETRVQTGTDAEGRPVYDISDDDFKERIRTAFDDISTGGSRASYIKAVLKAPKGKFVLDVAPYALEPEEGMLRTGQINVPLIFSDDLIPAEDRATLSGTEISERYGSAIREIQAYVERQAPLSDIVRVYKAEPRIFSIEAELTIKSGVSAGVVLADAARALGRYLAAQRKIGQPVTKTGIVASLFAGERGLFNVDDVTLRAPVEDIICSPDEYPDVKKVQDGDAEIPDIRITQKNRIGGAA